MRNPSSCWHPWSGARIDVSLSLPQFADDTTKQIVAEPGQDVVALAFEACFGSFEDLATHVLRHHKQVERVSRLVVTNECPACCAVDGDRNAAHRHLLTSIRRGFCRDRSRYLGQVHISLCLCCLVCAAEPGNWSELQQHLA